MASNWGARLRLGPDEAFAFLCDSFGQSAAGTGHLVLVSGGIASGKTRLQNDFLHYVANSGALTLGAIGAPDEQHLDTAVIDQLLTSSVLPAQAADRINAILACATRPGAGPAEPSTIQDICRVLLQLAHDRPVVICVDDLQFADETSVQLLLQLQRRIRSSRLLIVLNQRDRPATTRLRLHNSFAGLPHYHVQLTPMSRQAIGALLAGSLDGRPSGALAARIHELSAGNPMLAEALIEDCRGHDSHQYPVVGPAFAHAVKTFLHRCDALTQEVAAALAVLGPHGDAELVGRLVGIETGVAEETLGILTGAGLLDQGRFRHSKAEAAALDSKSPATRSRLHLRAAELRYRRAATAGDVAAHLVAAGAVAGDWSIPVLRQAAEQAVHADDVEFATRCLGLAISAATEARERQALVRDVAGLTFRVNPSAASSHLATLKQAALEGTLERADAMVLVRHALWRGDWDAITSTIDALAGSPGMLDPQTMAELKLAYQWYFGPIRLPGGRSIPAARPETDPWNHTARTLAQLWTRGGNKATTASAEQILRNCRLGDLTLEALSTAVVALAHDNQAERAEQWCASLSAEARRRGAVTWQAMLDGVWATITLRRGGAQEAVARARAALGLLSAQNWGVAVSYPLTALLRAATEIGEFEEAAKTLRYPTPDAMFETIGGLLYLRARGHYYLATDRALAAISDFQECQRLMRKWDVDAPTLVPWRSDLAEANLRLGEVAAAGDLANAQLELVGERGGYARGLSLRVLAFLREPDQRAPLLREAVECFEESGDRLELAKTTQALQQLPSRENAQLTLVEEDSGAPADVSAVLSEAELRVAQLAARGQTNRQIGRSLYITVSTVEQHLTRVYRKLGLSGRSGLPAKLDLEDPENPPANPDFRR